MSVIIPAFNAVPTLARCLEAVLASDYQPLEVIVVDDGSRDGTARLVEQDFPGVRLLRQANQGAAGARNSGARLARGSLWYFLDSDVVVEPRTIGQLVASVRDQRVDYVSGRYSTRPMNDGLIHHYKALFDYVYYIPERFKEQVYRDNQIGGGGDFFTRAAFEALGGYDATISGAGNEREECFSRLHQLGLRSLANPLIKTRHFFPDLGSLLRNIQQRVLENMLLMRKRPLPASYINPVPILGGAVAVFLMLLALPLAWLLPEQRAVLAALALGGGVAFVIFSRHFIRHGLRKKGGWMLVRMMPLHGFFLVFSLYAGLRAVVRCHILGEVRDG
ncbi:MAG: glycosyltransferase family 2 protein [Magnetococcales bacterium]|nr:glycosyltransferase family 2 protein [Magnetococcales bacterium]